MKWYFSHPASWSCIGRTGTEQIVQQKNVDGGVSGLLGDNYHLSPPVYTAIQMLLSLFPLKSEKGISSHACTTASGFAATWLTGLQRKRMIQSKMLSSSAVSWPKVLIWHMLFSPNFV